MQKRIWLILTIALSAYFLYAQNSNHENYIRAYKEIAISEMRRTGIPASIKLAQGILESAAGKSELARKANNHFGIKCHNNWNGKTYYREDDDYDDQGRLIKSCFRVYRDPESSFIAHSEFIRDPRKTYRYGFLFDLSPTDYKAWARGLKKAGYATSPTYANNLINIIERYDLNKYDDSSIKLPEDESPLADRDKYEEEILRGIFRNNGVKYALASGEESVTDLALRTDVSVDKLKKYNEKLRDDGATLQKDTRVYLQPKRNNYRGKRKYHMVKEGEDMYSIAQLYGIRLDKLRDKNRLSPREQPAPNERIKIRGWFKVKIEEKPRTIKESFRPIEDQKEELDEFIFEDPSEEFGREIEAEIEPPINEEEIIKDKPIDIEPNPIFVDDTMDEEEQEKPVISSPEFHEVVKGDTLFNISRRYSITVDTLKALNQLDHDGIQIGQRLRIK